MKLPKLFKSFEIYQILALLAGVVLAWTTTIKEFVKFYGFEGTIFKLRDCVIPNPVTTACFWGATAFLVALIWAVYIFRLKNKKKALIHQKKLFILLIASTVFGWGNVAYDFYKYFDAKMAPIQTCSGLVRSPFETSCFWGSILFLIALVITFFIVKKPKSS